jgi:hypothetical protein
MNIIKTHFKIFLTSLAFRFTQGKTDKGVMFNESMFCLPNFWVRTVRGRIVY